MAGNSRVTGKPARYQFGVIICLAISAIALFMHSTPTRAQQTGDLSQQMQMFNSLSPDQQQSILQRLGGGGGSSGIGGLGGLGSGSLSGGLGGFGGLGGYNASQSALMQQQLLQQQRRQQNQNEDQQDLFLPPVFKPGDTVLVDISLP